jgi:poly [ADP-ribose] polymerase
VVAAVLSFYTLIPHVVGRRPPEVISSKERLKAKLQLVESLGDIEIAMKVLADKKGAGEEEDALHPIDRSYRQLGCGMTALEPDSPTVQLIARYLKETHGQTHSGFQLELQQVFSLSRDGEEQRFAPFASTPNRMLLWHGSRLSNFTGIVSQGLRIAPPEAPVTGYMVSTATVHSRCNALLCLCAEPMTLHLSLSLVCCSSARARTSPTWCLSQPTIVLRIVCCLLLCDVALGEMNEKYAADYNASQLPPGKLSTKGLGRWAPDPSKWVKLEDGLVVPSGPAVEAKLASPPSLLYNEYIVYDVSQVRLRYLLQVKFKF